LSYNVRQEMVDKKAGNWWSRGTNILKAAYRTVNGARLRLVNAYYRIGERQNEAPTNVTVEPTEDPEQIGSDDEHISIQRQIVGVDGAREYEFYVSKTNGEASFEVVKPEMIDVLAQNISEDMVKNRKNIRVQVKISVGGKHMSANIIDGGGEEIGRRGRLW